MLIPGTPARWRGSAWWWRWAGTGSSRWRGPWRRWRSQGPPSASRWSASAWHSTCLWTGPPANIKQIEVLLNDKWHHHTWQRQTVLIRRYLKNKIILRSLAYVIFSIHSMVHNGQQPGCSLEGVSTTRFKMKSRESPVLQLTKEVSRTNRLCQVEFSFAIQTKNVLKYPRAPIKEILTLGWTIWVAHRENFTFNKLQCLDDQENSNLLSVVANLSLWSLLFGNLSIVSHLTWWIVPPTLRKTVQPKIFIWFPRRWNILYRNILTWYVGRGWLNLKPLTIWN